MPRTPQIEALPGMTPLGLKRPSNKSTPTTRKAKRAKATESNKDAIVLNKATTDGAYVLVQAGDGRHFLREKKGDNKAFRAVAQIGLPYVAAEKWHKANPVPRPQAKLARGVDGHNSPHSAKAVADQRKPAKGKSAPAAKAGKNKQPSKGAERGYTVVKGTENKARPDSWRYHMTAMIVGAADTAAAKAKHTKSGKFSNNKLDFNWAANNGFIKFS